MLKFIKWSGLIAIFIQVIFFLLGLLLHNNTPNSLFIGQSLLLGSFWLFVLLIFFVPSYYIYSIKRTQGTKAKAFRVVELLFLIGAILLNIWIINVPPTIHIVLLNWLGVFIPLFTIRYFFVPTKIAHPIIPIVFSIISVSIFFPVAKQIPRQQNLDSKISFHYSEYLNNIFSSSKPDYLIEHYGLFNQWENNLILKGDPTNTIIHSEWLDLYGSERFNFPNSKLLDDVYWDLVQDISNLPNSLLIAAISEKDTIDLGLALEDFLLPFSGIEFKDNIDFLNFFMKGRIMTSNANAPPVVDTALKKTFIPISIKTMELLKDRDEFLNNLRMELRSQVINYLLLLISVIPLLTLFFYIPTFNISEIWKSRLLLFIVIILFEFGLLMLDNLAQGFFSNPFILLGMNILLAAGLVYLDGFIRNDFLKWYENPKSE